MPRPAFPRAYARATMQLAHKRATAAARATAAMRPSLALRARSVVSMQPSVVLHARRSSTRALAVVAPAEVNSPLAPAVLEGTPKPGEFPISSERLIELAKALYEARAGVKDPSLLSDDFRFEFPVISLSKQEYVKAVSSFRLADAFPDMSPNPYDWRVDPYEPNRVWFTVRNAATHTGDLKFFNSAFKATNKRVLGAPECMSYVFNAEGKCTSYTGGYVMDRRVGNTQGLGAMFGILAAIGGPVLKPGSLAYTLLMLQSQLVRVFHAITFGLFKGK